jgi:hypothetical protein
LEYRVGIGSEYTIGKEATDLMFFGFLPLVDILGGDSLGYFYTTKAFLSLYIDTGDSLGPTTFFNSIIVSSTPRYRVVGGLGLELSANSSVGSLVLEGRIYKLSSQSSPSRKKNKCVGNREEKIILWVDISELGVLDMANMTLVGVDRGHHFNIKFLKEWVECS